LSPVAVAIDLSLGKLLRCPERPSSAKSGQFEVHRKERKLMPSLTKFIWISVAFISAITLAFLSVYVERVGPELAVYGNMCGPSGYDFCYKPVLKGGFPVAYLFDSPGVSRERVLAFGEDKLSMGALVLDIAIYFAIVVLVMLGVSRFWLARVQATSRART